MTQVNTYRANITANYAANYADANNDRTGVLTFVKK